VLAREDHHALLLELVWDVLFDEALHWRDALIDALKDTLLVLVGKTLQDGVRTRIDLWDKVSLVGPDLCHQLPYVCRSPTLGGK
jgi:hypothetical protein